MFKKQSHKTQVAELNVLLGFFSSQEQYTLVSPLSPSASHHHNFLMLFHHKLTECLTAATLRNPLSNNPLSSLGSRAEGVGQILPHPFLTCTRPHAILSSNFILDSSILISTSYSLPKHPSPNPLKKAVGRRQSRKKTVYKFL